MAVVPTTRPSRQLRTAGATPSVAAAGAVGAALAGVGREVSAIGSEAMSRQRDADNAAFRTERTNSLLRTWTERLADAETTGTEVDLGGLKEEFDADVERLGEGAPSDEAGQAFQLDADNAFSRKFFPGFAKNQSRINVKKRTNATLGALDDINAEVLTGRTSVSEAFGRAESAIVGLGETAAGVIDIDKLRENTRNQIGRNALTARINQGDHESVFKEIQRGDWDKFTSARDLETLQRQALKAESDAESAREAEASKQASILASDLEIAVFRDESTYADVEAALESGIITPAKRTQLVKRLDDNADKTSKKADNLVRVQTSLSMGIPLDPTSKEDKAGVEDMWQAQQEEVGAEDPETFANRAVAFVQSTRILPASLKGSIAAFARSGNPDQAGQAADIVARMQEIDSPALNDLTKESYAFGLSVMDLVRGGVDQARAVDIARENAFGQTAQEKKVSTLVLKGASAENTTFLNDKLDEFDPGIFSAQPELTPVLQAEFEVLLGEMVPFTGGNIESARNMAWASIKNVWGATSVGGGIRMMKYSPEAIYGKGGDTQWITEQFTADITELGVDPENAMIAADTKTARSDQPSYPVFTKNEDGVVVPMLDSDNIPLRWKPEFSSSPLYKELQEEQQRKINKSKFRRNIRETRARWERERFKRGSKLALEFQDATR